MKSSAIVRIILFSVLILVLLTFLFVGISMRLYSFDGKTVSSVTVVPAEVAVFSASEIDRLEINWVSGTIEIRPEDTDEIMVSEDNSDPKYPMVLKQSGSKLMIQDRKDNQGVSILKSTPRKNLYISVPKSWICKELSVDSASAQIVIGDMIILNTDFDVASGAMILTNCHIQKLDIDSASGNLDFSGTLEELDFDGASANADMTIYNKPKVLKMDGMSGKMELTLPEDCGFTVKQDSLSGKADIDFETKSTNGNLVYGDGSCRITVDGLSSNLTIHKSSDAAIVWSMP